MPAYDVIVIGVGGMGSAACYHLARRGMKVLGIEQFGVAHDRGSSHGQTRIIRKAYYEHPDYVPLLHRAFDMWEELQAARGQTLFQRCGLVLFGRPEGVVVSGVRRCAAQHQLRIESIPNGELPTRFPAFAPGPALAALYEADAGYLKVEACIHAHVQAALGCGAALVCGQKVTGWSAEGDGVRVTTDAATHLGQALVVCAGPWSSALLCELGLPLEVRRKVQLWFACQDQRYGVERGCPAYCFDLDEGFFYGFPMIEPGMVKVCEHSGRQPVEDPGRLDRALRAEDIARVRGFVADHLPGVASEVVRHSVCMYTMTPDEHFIIDRHREHANVFFAAGFSGHGFKFAPIVGSILADLVMEGRTREPIAFLSGSRPTLRG